MMTTRTGGGLRTILTLAGGGHQALGSAVVAPVAGAAVGQHAAADHPAQDPDLAEDESVLEAVADGRPELLEAIAEYRRVTQTLAGSGGSPADETAPAELERLVARQGAAMERIDALGGGTTSTGWRRC